MLPGREAEVNKKTLLLRLRRDPWDRHRAIMRASPWVTGQENREAFVRAVCGKKNAEPSRPSPPPLLLPLLASPLPPPCCCFFFLPKDAHKCLYTLLSVFASGPKWTRLSLQLVGGWWGGGNRASYVVKIAYVSIAFWDVCSVQLAAKSNGSVKFDFSGNVHVLLGKMSAYHLQTARRI